MEKEQPLEYWCDMMVKTYNTSVLDNFPESLKSSLAKQCVESKPNPNSYTQFFGLIKRKKNRNVLMRLINNYFRSKQIQTFPTVDFIGGPHTLTLHWSDKYKKIIYILGEYHRNDVCDYDNMMRVEDYLRRLFRHSGSFIDFFLEIPMFVKGKYNYNFDYDDRLNVLRNQNKECIETSQIKENRHCDTKRVHFIDIRQGPLSKEEFEFFKLNSTVYFELFFQNFIDNIIIKKNRIKDRKKKKKKPYILSVLTNMFKGDDNKLKPTIDFILFGTNETYKDFWKKELETHEFINDELSKSTEETKIREFAEEEFKINIYRPVLILSINKLRIYLTKCYVEKGIYNFYQLSDDEYIKFLNELSIFKRTLTHLNSLLVDVYTLARIFKKFELNHTTNSGTTRKTDEPAEPHNIIMYAGNRHSDRVRSFLDETLEFDLISESKGDPEVDFCVDIRNFEQPFFSSWPKKMLLEPMSISDFQMTLESRNETDEDETQLEMLIYEGTLIYKGSDTNIIEKMGIKDLAIVSITFYSSELTEYHYYTYNRMSTPIKWKSYNIPYQGIITQSTNFIMHSNKMVKKYSFLENFKYIDYFFIMVSLQKALDSKIISDSSNIILQLRIPSKTFNRIKSMIKLLEHYEGMGFEQMFPENYEEVMENIYHNENDYIPMIGNVKMIMYLFRMQRHTFKVAYDLLDTQSIPKELKIF